MQKIMNPKVYLYNKTDRGFELYLGEHSTLEGLSVFEKACALSITSFGATCYKKHGWATEKELPTFENVGNVIKFLESEGDIGIVEFEASLPEFGTFSSHDDRECHYITQSKRQCMSILKAVIPPLFSDMLINKLVCNPNYYVTCNNFGVVEILCSFSEYLNKNV